MTARRVTDAAARRPHVAWINDAADVIGGAERYVSDTARRLRERGVRSTLYYDVAGPMSTAMLDAFDDAFPVVDLPNQLAALAPDVVYMHQVADTRVSALLARCPARLAVLRFFHDHRLFCLREHKYTTVGQKTCTQTIGANCYPCLGFVNRAPSWPGIRLATLGTLRAEHRHVQGFDGVVVGSRYMADHVVAHGFDPARVYLAPLYAARGDERTANQTPVPTRERDLILVVGALTRGKGIDVLLRALAYCRQPARVALVGVGPQETEFRALAHELGIASRVAFEGHKTPEQLGEYYRRAACLAMPTRAPETFGLVGIEAIAHGLPVVAALVGGITEWLRDGETGLGVPPNDPQALASALDRLLADAVLGERLVANGQRMHEERFLPEHHIARLMDIFRAVAPGRFA